jgi:hypothetical protein
MHARIAAVRFLGRGAWHFRVSGRCLSEDRICQQGTVRADGRRGRARPQKSHAGRLKRSEVKITCEQPEFQRRRLYRSPFAPILRYGGFIPGQSSQIRWNHNPQSCFRSTRIMTLSIAHLQPIVSLLAGILILIMPQLLNYIVAIFLIVSGILGLGLVH